MSARTAPRARRRHPGPGRQPHLNGRQAAAVFTVALAAGITLRLWRLGTSPAWQWDEGVYWRVSVSVQHGALAEHSVYGLPWVAAPSLYCGRTLS